GVRAAAARLLDRAAVAERDLDLVRLVVAALDRGLEPVAAADQPLDRAVVVVLAPPPERLGRGDLPNGRLGQARPAGPRVAGAPHRPPPDPTIMSRARGSRLA